MNPDEIKKQIEELESLRSQTGRWRIGSVLAILVIMVVCVAKMIGAVTDLAREGPKQKEFMAEMERGLKSDVVPTLEKIAAQTVNEIKPAIDLELKRLNDRVPDVAAALHKELEALSTNLPKRGEKILEASFGAVIKKREDKIRKLYPGITEDKIATLVTTLTAEANDQIDHIVTGLFAPHILALTHVTENVAHIQKTEKVDGTAEFPTWEMASLVFDLLHEEFKGLDTTPEAASKRELKKKEPKK